MLHHLQLGEDVLGVMAGASAGSGSRMAFAFGAMPATGQQKAHVHQYGSLAPEDRERRRLAALQHAGLATAAAAAAAAGGGAGGGADGEQRLLSVRRMWASMPLGLALQVGEWGGGVGAPVLRAVQGSWGWDDRCKGQGGRCFAVCLGWQCSSCVLSCWLVSEAKQQVGMEDWVVVECHAAWFIMLWLCGRQGTPFYREPGVGGSAER